MSTDLEKTKKKVVAESEVETISNCLDYFVPFFLREFVLQNSIESAIEFGCGAELHTCSVPFTQYFGIDESDDIIKTWSNKYKDDPKKQFIHVDSAPKKFTLPVPTTDLAILTYSSADHIDSRHNSWEIAKAFEISSKYILIICTSNSDQIAITTESYQSEWELFSCIANKHSPATNLTDEGEQTTLLLFCKKTHSQGAIIPNIPRKCPSSRFWKDDTDAFKIIEHAIPDSIVPQTSAISHASDAIHGKSNPRILDLGCGAGLSYESFATAHRKVEWIGCDIEASDEVNSRVRDDLTFVTYDGVLLPFPDCHFDVIYCNQVFEHVQKPGPLLKEIYRVLKPSGAFIGQVSQLEPYHSRSLWNFTPYGMNLLASEAGLKLERLLPGIDALTLIHRRIDGRPKAYSHLFEEEQSPLHNAIDRHAQTLKESPKKVNYKKILFSGQFIFKFTKASEKKERVIIYTRALTCGGLEKVSAQTSQALALQGYEPIIVVQNDWSIDYAYSGKIIFDDINNNKLFSIIDDAVCIIDFTWKEGSTTPLLQYIIDNYSEKLIATAHNTQTIDNYLGEFTKKLDSMENLASIVCVSEAVKRVAQERYGSLSNLAVIHNTVVLDTSIIEDSPPQKRPYFLFAGRLTAVKQKGIDTLLHAWAKSSSRLTHDLILIGDGKLPPEIITLARELNIESSIHAKSFTTDIANWMSHARALLLPSRWEGFGLVLVESLMCGTPCITTKCGGTEEIIQNEFNGLLTDIDDVNELHKAIDRIESDDTFYNLLCSNTQTSIDSFGFDNYSQKWAKVISQVAKTAEGKSRRITATGPTNNFDLVGSAGIPQHISLPSPKISVQIPVYNKENDIEDCLNSILAQTFHDFEIICIDDCSTDNSYQILQRYAKQDTRVRVFRNLQNMGTLYSRKKCLEEAEGDYLVFVDADDFAKPTMLQDLYEQAISSSSDFVQCGAEVFDPTNTLSDKVLQRYHAYFTYVREFTAEGEDIIRHIFNPIKVNLWISLINKDVYKAVIPYIPEDRVQHGNDNLLIFLFAYFAQKYTTLNKPLYRYRANPTSSNLTIPTGTLMCEHIRSRAQVLKHAKEFMGKVDPDWNETLEPFPRYSDSAFNYCTTLTERCLTKYPEEREKVLQCLGDNFGGKAVLYLDENMRPPAEVRRPKTINNIQEEIRKVSIFHLVYIKSPPWIRTFYKTIRHILGGKRIPNAKNRPPAPMTQVRTPRTINVVQDKILKVSMLDIIYIKSPAWIRAFYKITKRDLTIPLINTYKDLRNFFIIWRSGLFFPDYYLMNNPDIQTTKRSPLWHFVKYGSKEGRDPNPLFSVSWYKSEHPEVTKNNVCPLIHYIILGWKEGHSPSQSFSVSAYYSKHPDVRDTAVEPLGHYLKQGIFEGVGL